MKYIHDIQRVSKATLEVKEEEDSAKATEEDLAKPDKDMTEILKSEATRIR